VYLVEQSRPIEELDGLYSLLQALAGVTGVTADEVDVDSLTSVIEGTFAMPGVWAQVGLNILSHLAAILRSHVTAASTSRFAALLVQTLLEPAMPEAQAPAVAPAASSMAKVLVCLATSMVVLLLIAIILLIHVATSSSTKSEL
jgi:hypothetical protein